MDYIEPASDFEEMIRKHQEYRAQGSTFFFLAIESPLCRPFSAGRPRIWPQRFPDFVKQLLMAVLLEKILDPLHQMLEKPEVDVMQYTGFEKKGKFDT